MNTDPLPDHVVQEIVDLTGPGSQAVGHQDHANYMARRIKAVTMRLAGMTYEQIATEAGYGDKSTARHVVIDALRKTEVERVDELRALENARLDRAQAAIWPKVLAGDPKSVDVFLRLSVRRARMNGLDAPQQITVSSDASAGLEDALADLREVVLGEVLPRDAAAG